jgi:NACHT domain
VSVLAAIVVKLGETLVKSACEAVTGSKIAGDMSGGVAAVLGQEAATSLGHRRARRQLEELADHVAARVLTRYGHEFRGLSADSRAVVIGAVRETFERTSLGAGLVLAEDFDASAVERAIRSDTAEFRRSWSFGADERGLYDLLLRESCADLVEIVRRMASLASLAPEILTRLTHLTAEARSAPRRALNEAARDADSGFAEIYRRHVTGELDTVDLTSERLSSTSRRYPLGLAYLSLPVLVSADGAPMETRIEQALVGRPRVVLRAECGGGKTTYLHRLFMLVARRALTGPLAELNDAIPFYIPLHQYADADLPAPEKFLDAVARDVLGEMPQGWVQRQLRDRESLVLLNGVDEVPPDRRPAVLDWVARLTHQFPRPRYVLAGRPASIPEDWPASVGFQVVDLLPMGQADVCRFIRRWHESVGSTLSDPVARAEVDQDAKALTEALGASHALRVLSRNPLVCALMCALHRDRQVRLPDQWLDLLRIVVEILVGERDLVRGVADGLALPIEKRMRALQDIAFWMTTEDLSGGEFDEVLARVKHLVGGLGPEPADARTVLDHLTVRSGLMHLDRDGMLRFTSPILRDYLAAREAVAGNNIRFLVRESHLPARQPLIIMAAGHAQVTRAEELLTGLLTRADADTDRRNRFHVLARACLQAAPGVGEDLRERVRNRSTALLSPRTEQEAAELATTGPFVLDMLVTDRELDPDVAAASIHTAIRVGDDTVLPFLSRFASDPHETVQHLLLRAWPSFDPVEYASVVLTWCPSTADPVPIDATVLPAVACVPWLRRVRIMDHTCDGAVDVTPLAGLRDLTVYVPAGTCVRGADLLGEGSEVVMGGDRPE